MGHDSQPTIVFVGLARLPQPLVAAAPCVAVELEVEPEGRSIVAVTSNLQLPCLERLLPEVLVGRTVDSVAGSAALDLHARYSAAFATAVATAVEAALRGAAAALPGGERQRLNGARPSPVPSSPDVSKQPAQTGGRLPALPASHHSRWNGGADLEQQ
jgi:hypothetical protein